MATVEVADARGRGKLPCCETGFATTPKRTCSVGLHFGAADFVFRSLRWRQVFLQKAWAIDETFAPSSVKSKTAR
jgi:hypothetical protein